MPKELLEFLLDRYQEQDLGAAGEEALPAPLDELDKTLDTEAERMAARAGITHFLKASRQYLLDHPPQTHIMLAQGFGVQLAGGAEVSLTPNTIEDLEGIMENTPTIPVTLGRSIRGQGGVVPSEEFAVTGTEDTKMRKPIG